MDNYIKMCIEAKEIQKKLRNKFDFRYQKGYCPRHNCFLNDNRDNNTTECPIFENILDEVYDEDSKEWERIYNKEDCVDFWIGLPTIKQLRSLVNLCWWEFDKHCANYHFDSKEETALAFIMSLLFDKTWSGKEWIEEKKVNEEN